MPNDSAAAFAASHSGRTTGLLILKRPATRVIPGIISFISSTRFGASSVAKELNPVTLPPGRARLATAPVTSGSPIAAITIGITVVACFAARTRRCSSGHDRVDFETNQLGRQIREAFGAPVRRVVFDEQVLSLDIAELAEALLERRKIGCVERPRDCLQHPYAPDFSRRLLRAFRER